MSSSELESESEEDAALRFNLFVVAGLLSWSESESELELELESEVEVDFVLGFVLDFNTLGISSESESELELELESELEVDFVLGFVLDLETLGISSESESELELESELEDDFALYFDTLDVSSESESELELELTAGDEVAGFFARATFLLLPLFLEVGTEFESVSTLDSSLESEPVSSVDSSSLSTSSAEESVLLESRCDSNNFATCGTASSSWGLSSLSSLLSSESM